MFASHLILRTRKSESQALRDDVVARKRRQKESASAGGDRRLTAILLSVSRVQQPTPHGSVSKTVSACSSNALPYAQLSRIYALCYIILLLCAHIVPLTACLRCVPKPRMHATSPFVIGDGSVAVCAEGTPPVSTTASPPCFLPPHTLLEYSGLAGSSCLDGPTSL